MAGFTSLDDMVNRVSTEGKFFRSDWQKSTFTTTAHTAGLWYSLFRGGGNPPADTILGTGTNLAFQALTDTPPTRPASSMAVMWVAEPGSSTS